MDHSLVVLHGSNQEEQVVRESISLSAGIGAHIEFIALFTPDEVEQNIETLETIGEVERAEYDSDDIDLLAQQTIDAGLQQTGASVNYDLTAMVVEQSNHADTIVREVTERDCDHVFIGGQKRSPTGKAVFGDVVQSVLLNVDVPVTSFLGDLE